MTDQKILNKFNGMKSTLLERSVSFHTRKQFTQLNLQQQQHQQQQQFKITFIKEVGSNEQHVQAPVIVASSTIPTKRIFRPVNNRSSSLTSATPAKSIAEKCVYCIENEYRKEIKEAFNKFIDNNSSFNKCTCEMLKKSIAFSKSARNRSYRKLSLESPTNSTSDTTMNNDKSDKFDFYFKNITNSLNKLSSFESDNEIGESVDKDKGRIDNNNKENETKNKKDPFSNIYTNSSMSVIDHIKTNVHKNEPIIRSNSNTDVSMAINLDDIERIKEKYTNYLRNKEKNKKQEFERKQQKPVLLKRAATTLHGTNTKNWKFNKDEMISSISSAINQLTPSKETLNTNKKLKSSKYEKKFTIINENQLLTSLPRETPTEKEVDLFKNESSLNYIDMTKIDQNAVDTICLNKKDDEIEQNDLIANSEILTSNSVIKLQTDVVINVENAIDVVSAENVPDMEEVTTTLIQPKSNYNNNNNNLFNGFGIVSGVNNSSNSTTKGTPRSNEFILPPIGENELNLASTNNYINRQSSTGTKSARADSGIGDLDQHGNNNTNNNNNNNNGWVNTPNGSDNGGNEQHYVETNKENFQKKNTLKKNPTSSTLYSYGHSSNLSKQTHTTSVFSSKNSNHGSNYVDVSNSSTIKLNHKPSNVSQNKHNHNHHDEQTYSQKQNSAPNSQNSVKRTESDLNINNSKPTLVRQNSQFIRNNSIRQSQQQQQQQQHHSQQPVVQHPIPKPRQQNTDTQRSTSLQRQASFTTDITSTNKQNYKINHQQANIKQRNSFAIHNHNGNSNIKLHNNNNNNNNNNKQQQLSANQVNNTRPSTSTSHRNQPTQQQKQPINSQQQQNKTSKSNETNEALNNQLESDLKTQLTDSEINEQTKYRINEWLVEVERCTSLRPPSALSWFGATNTTRVINHHNNSNKNINHDTSSMNDDDFDLSEYDSSDEQIVEYNRVVDKTYCVVYDK